MEGGFLVDADAKRFDVGEMKMNRVNKTRTYKTFRWGCCCRIRQIYTPCIFLASPFEGDKVGGFTPGGSDQNGGSDLFKEME